MSKQNPPKGAPELNGRRSQRVFVSVPVSVRTETSLKGVAFKEDTQTYVVNAHGALIALAGRIEQGQTLYIINSATHEEQECRVIHVGQMTGGKAQIGIEFTKPSPAFWRIAFPPEDWTAPVQAPAASKLASSRQAQAAPPVKRP